MWTSVPMNLRSGKRSKTPEVIILAKMTGKLPASTSMPRLLARSRCWGTPSAVIFEPRSPAGKKNWVCTLIGMSQLDRGGPEPVVLGRRLGERSARVRLELDRPQAELGDALELVEAVLETGGGQGGVADEALGRVGLELRDPVVVDLEAGQG